MLQLLLVAVVLSQGLALDNGLALTPPMGWLSWLHFGCTTDCDKYPDTCLSEDLIKRTADRLVSDGYKDAGYEYIIIDDCWLERNRTDGKMVPDRKRFKSGMKALADYIHSKGLKFGMYQDIGEYTCEKYPGLKGHEAIDVETFAEWEIDYLKVDGCFEPIADMPKDYPALQKLLNKTGRPILYSCSWPAYSQPIHDYTPIAENCNIWRNYNDISCSWESILSIMDWFGERPELKESAGPGHFHDPDMLVIGNNCTSLNQAAAQMAVWSILAAPLLISMDLDKMPNELKRIILNKNVISIDQDPLAKMGERIQHNDDVDVWRRKVVDATFFAIVRRRNKTDFELELTHEDLQLENIEYRVRNLYEENDTFYMARDSKLRVKINPTGVKFYEFKPIKQIMQEDSKNWIDTVLYDIRKWWQINN